MSPRLALLSCVAASTLLACGGAEAGRLAGTNLGRVVEAPGAGAEVYATSAAPDPAIGAAGADAVGRGVARAAQERGVSMEGDGRLALLAAWTAEHLGEGGAPPPHDVVEFFARHLGLVEPVPHLLILGQPDPAMLEAAIADSVSQFLARQPYNRWGAAVVAREGLTLAIVTLSWRWVELEPVARRLPARGPIRIRGSLLGDFVNPSFAVTQPDGSVERSPAGTGPAFDVALPTRGAGEYRIELLAQGARGDSVIANFPVYVGVEVPDSVTLGAAAAGTTTDATAVSEELTRLLNATRRQHGLSPVETDPQIAAVARAHSADMVSHHFVGHTSPTTGSAADRVQAAGLSIALVLENIGRGYAAQEIHEGLLASPGHRANLLNPDVTHVGVGVLAEPEGERTAFVATQVFLRMTREIDVSRAPAELLRLINEARSARGASPLEGEPNLMSAAQDAAVEYFEDPGASQQDVVDSASARLRRFSIAFRRVGGLMTLVTAIEEAARLEPTFDPELRYVGIGVSQGSRPDTGPNAIAVVIVLAWPR